MLLRVGVGIPMKQFFDLTRMQSKPSWPRSSYRAQGPRPGSELGTERYDALQTVLSQSGRQSFPAHLQAHPLSNL